MFKKKYFRMCCKRGKERETDAFPNWNTSIWIIRNNWRILQLNILKYQNEFVQYSQLKPKRDLLKVRLFYVWLLWNIAMITFANDKLDNLWLRSCELLCWWRGRTPTNNYREDVLCYGRATITRTRELAYSLHESIYAFQTSTMSRFLDPTGSLALTLKILVLVWLVKF